MVRLELAAGVKLDDSKRGLVKVTGRLVLNRTDPEDFLFLLKDAKFGEAD
jgi:hypothetical protein